jgi:hypothetical protein
MGFSLMKSRAAPWQAARAFHGRWNLAAAIRAGVRGGRDQRVSLTS